MEEGVFLHVCYGEPLERLGRKRRLRKVTRVFALEFFTFLFIYLCIFSEIQDLEEIRIIKELTFILDQWGKNFVDHHVSTKVLFPRPHKRTGRRPLGDISTNRLVRGLPQTRPSPTVCVSTTSSVSYTLGEGYTQIFLSPLYL